MKRFFLLSTILLFSLGLAFAAQVDTVKVFSPSMQKDIKAAVILPDAYESGKEFPVVYLLHGYGGNHGDWVNKVPKIKELADEHSFIIVCPDGGKGSWYWDSPIDESFKYETFVAKELVDWVDKNYKSLASRKGRAITGLSMGGHGALYLAFKHQAVFGAAGSMSGGVDIRSFPKNWEMESRLGSYASNPERWGEHTVMNMLHLLTPKSLQLIIDCGTSDFFNSVNLKLHEELLLRNIDHTFISQSGGHSWEYWEKSVPVQFLFMNTFFEKERVGS